MKEKYEFCMNRHFLNFLYEFKQIWSPQLFFELICINSRIFECATQLCETAYNIGTTTMTNSIGNA